MFDTIDATDFAVDPRATSAIDSIAPKKDDLNQSFATSKYEIQTDVVIGGAGASGLALAYQLLQNNAFRGEIVIFDRDLTPKDDKIWSFWETGWIPDAITREVTAKCWDRFSISVEGLDRTESMMPNRYCSIRSGDYLPFMMETLKRSNRVRFVEDSFERLYHHNAKVTVEAGSHNITADFFASSIPLTKPASSKREVAALQQFVGWEIETDAAVFESDCFTFMDFQQSDHFDFGFSYVLPFSEHHALVEQTIFAQHPVRSEHLVEELIAYIENRWNLGRDHYRIVRREEGIIPMENRSTQPENLQERVFAIGAAAGCTRASTGYTFARSWKHAAEVSEAIAHQKTSLDREVISSRHRFFDHLFLYQLKRNPQSVKGLIAGLFKEPDTERIFRFLTGTTSLSEELSMVHRMPVIPFAKAFLSNLSHLIR